MDPLQLWASVRFTAQNGDTGGLLTAAAQSGLHLSAVAPLPGGFGARCAAWHYRPLSKLARKRRVRLRIQQRDGLFFWLRPLLRCRGLWAGLCLFVPLLLWLQGAVWAIDFTTLTPGQQARAAVVLRDHALEPGAFISEKKLTAGEYALLQSGEFSWASLNFAKGRLVVEAAAAKPVPEIAAGTLHGITARVAGTVLETNLTSGTMLVTPGQQVEAGQGLIGTARTERDGTLIFQPAAGRVLAQFEWEFAEALSTTLETDQLTGAVSHRYKIHFGGKAFSLPHWGSLTEEDHVVIRHLHPAFGELTLPCSLEEATLYHTQRETLSYTEDQLLSLARLHSRQALYAAYPDAVIQARKEDFSPEDSQFHYRVCYTVTADICQENTKTAEG